jgi:hypothetical protein
MSSSKSGKTSSRSTPREDRLNCRIDKGLLDWVRWYAGQRRTTVTQLVINYFQHLKSSYEESGISEVDQF